jgi:hypothetical protein
MGAEHCVVRMVGDEKDVGTERDSSLTSAINRQ